LRWLRLCISAATLDFDIGAFCQAAVALAGFGDLLPACIPLEIFRKKHTTLHLLPACLAKVNCIPGATELNILPELTTDWNVEPSASPAARRRGYPPLHPVFLCPCNR
jgi:hypothetical protein